ncbi:hypothetical protein Poly24_37200 [Rosistilla carotiformis]|uniref:Carboxypeptidase regulatory-like domain-containing protein n=1 Tax=Rosistilla carotiformis TaxID=2528017 RepID=A0A518JWS5_9BACT|nr:hypothetical protein Poly24_37200 [Rosistilla carotiformis]
MRIERLSKTWLDVCVVATCCFALVGCGPSGHPGLIPVSGKVTIDGEPLQTGTVEFIPDTSKGTTGQVAFGQIGADGTFQLRTFEPNDGVKPGSYKVGVQAMEVVPFDPEAPEPPSDKSLIPTRYADAITSGLTAEVKPESNDPLQFELFSKP